MSIKLLLEAIVTITCLFGIYAYTFEKNIFAPSAEQIAVEHAFAASNYEKAKTTYSIEELQAMAKQEADKMMKTGDTSEYEGRLRENKHLQKIITDHEKPK